MYANMKRMNNEMAVSPIVATLVLIVVAVIGAVAVGTIMGTFSSQVSKQASASQAASASATEILVAGSTTLLPAELNLQTDYQKINPGIQVNVQGGGSGAGVASVASGISDIGASSAAATITTAQGANPNDPNYQNLYYTMVGGRGVVFIENSDGQAVSGGSSTTSVNANDVKAAYNEVDQGTSAKTLLQDGNISIGTTMEQREAGSGTMQTAFTWAGLSSNAQKNGINNSVTNTGNAAMLASVQTTAHSFGFVDAGYAFVGTTSSTVSASNIIILNVTDNNGAYSATHAKIKAALKDWVKGQSASTETNYPQALTGGLYWITKGTAPTQSVNGVISTPGTSAAGSVVTDLINFAKSPTEATAFNNAGMYSLYDFAPTS